MRATHVLLGVRGRVVSHGVKGRHVGRVHPEGGGAPTQAVCSDRQVTAAISALLAHQRLALPSRPRLWRKATVSSKPAGAHSEVEGQFMIQSLIHMIHESFCEVTT